MVTGHNDSPFLILPVMSPFQTVLFRIFFFFFFFLYNYHKKIMDAFLQNLKVLRANRKKAIFNKNENNYTSKVETLTSPKLMTFEQWHEISNNVVCATSKGSDQPAHTRSLIRAFVGRLNIL